MVCGSSIFVCDILDSALLDEIRAEPVSDNVLCKG